MQVGIIGLPNVGKSTIFNILANASAEVASYPFSTIEPNVGIIEVPDANLEPLSRICNSSKTTPATIKFLDVAGLVKGASKGEGLGNKFLSHIRTADVLAHVVRCFYNSSVSYMKDEVAISEDIDPSEDIDIITTELLLADIEILSRNREKLKSIAKSGDSLAKSELDLVTYVIDVLNEGNTSLLDLLDEKQKVFLRKLNLISIKPILYVANMGEDEKSENLYRKLVAKVGEENVIKIYAKFEAELKGLSREERQEYRKEFGIENGLERFINTCYRMLNLITFYTINENEARAWSLRKGEKVIKAAGKIHSDMERGFIKAEVINLKDLLEAGSIQVAKERGKLRIEGKDYVVCDQDVIQIRFSV